MKYLFLLISVHSSFADNFNKLIKSIRSNDHQTFFAVLKEDVDVNKKKWGVTPLYIAVHFDRDTMIEPLLKKGAQVNSLNGSKKRTAIHKAVSKGSEVIVKCLLDAGADIFQANKKGEIPLDEAKKINHEGLILLLSSSK